MRKTCLRCSNEHPNRAVDLGVGHPSYLIRGILIGVVLGFGLAYWYVSSWIHSIEPVKTVVYKPAPEWSVRNQCVKWWFDFDAQRIADAQKFMCGTR